jgi:hypothetical protein
MLAHLILALSSITLTVQSTSHEGTWSCLVDLQIETQENGDQITVTVHKPRARMEPDPKSPPLFRKAITAESPSQQRAISLLDGKSVTFKAGDKDAKFPADVMFAGVDASYWFALLWSAGAPRTHSTVWGIPWKLTGDVTVAPGARLATSGTLEGDLTAHSVRRHLKITLTPQSGK